MSLTNRHGDPLSMPASMLLQLGIQAEIARRILAGPIGTLVQKYLDDNLTAQQRAAVIDLLGDDAPVAAAMAKELKRTLEDLEDLEQAIAEWTPPPPE